MANPLAALGQMHSDDASNMSAIAAKSKMVADYNATATPKAPAAPSINATQPADKINPKAKYGDKKGEQRIDTSGMTKPLGSFKKGGKVKKTGVYKLHAKEQVVNAKNTAKMDKMGGLAKVLAGKK